MKKYIFVMLFACLSGESFAQSLTDTEKRKVRDVVSQYCKLLSDYAESKNNAGNRDKIYDLFPSNVGDVEKCVVDDLIKTDDSNKISDMTSISNYMSQLSSPDKFNYRVKINYPDNVYNMDVSMFAFGNHKEKSGRINYGRIRLTKRMKGDVEKTTNNVFHVNLSNLKIERILVESENANDDNAVNILDKGGRAYAAKRYEKALEYFEKSARKNDFEAMYQTGYMYYAKLGCKNLSGKERKNRAYYWLNKLAARYIPHIRYSDESPIAQARELLDRMGYYD